MPRTLLSLTSLIALLVLAFPAAAEIPPIHLVLPPVGLEIPADVRMRLEGKLAATKKRLEVLREHPLAADVEVFTKGVEFALLHREFYVPKDFDKADWAFDEANKRLDALEKGDSPWTKATGLVVRGYRSSIDGSAQPYGLVITANHDFSKPSPLYVWLHGRGDKATDLHFLSERATKAGQIAPPGAIVLHAFGRQCVGYKGAGGADVYEALVSAKGSYAIDDARVVLIGFSMGGAGAWNLGAHSDGTWVAVSPGAGFAETARYQNLTPEKYPPWYEQTLWGQYDVPCYVRNLFNLEVIAYSGEKDKQIQAARVMEEAYRAEGRELTHLIGPGVEHKYEPKTLEELLRRLAGIVAKGREPVPQKVSFQTRTLDTNQFRWVSVDGLGEHWKDARVDAEIVGPGRLRVATKNVTALGLSPWEKMQAALVEIDGQSVTLGDPQGRRASDPYLIFQEGKWQPGRHPRTDLRKSAERHGPIDDAFTEWFVVVTPSGKSQNPKFQQWMEFELAHLRQRWRALMRGDLPEVRDVDFDSTRYTSGPVYFGPHLILWGDPQSNRVWRELNEQLPIKHTDGKWTFGGKQFDGNQFVPAAIYPYPGSSRSYVVLNSGLTFREGHDRTNSLQNPKLPDWAIIDLSQPPDGLAPGKIHDAGFFDEQWQLKNPPRGG
ncbi:MAG: alpha/beta hydrolase [Pirellulaceae bacterium]|nr:alpha/beta hydrolase [Pirellulaceae bacterium]